MKHLQEKTFLEKAIQIALKLEDEEERASALKDICIVQAEFQDKKFEDIFDLFKASLTKVSSFTETDLCIFLTGKFRIINEIIPTLVKTGKIKEAKELLDFAENDLKDIEDNDQKFEALKSILIASSHTGDLERTRNHLLSVLSLTKIISEDEDEGSLVANSNLVGNISVELIESSCINEAKEIAEAIKDPCSKARILSNIAIALAEKGNIQEAKEFLFFAKNISKDISNEDWFSDILFRDLAGAYLSVGEIEKAQKTILSLNDDYEKARMLSQLAAKFAETKEIKKAKEILSLAEGFANNMLEQEITKEERINADRASYIVVMTKIATVYMQIGDIGKFEAILNNAEEIITKITDEDHKSWGLCKFATFLAEYERVDMAKKFIATIPEIFYKNKALIQITDIQTKARNIDAALNTISSGAEESFELPLTAYKILMEHNHL